MCRVTSERQQMLGVRDVCHGDRLASLVIVNEAIRDALQAWIRQAALEPEDLLFRSRLHDLPHLGSHWSSVELEVSAKNSLSVASSESGPSAPHSWFVCLLEQLDQPARRG